MKQNIELLLKDLCSRLPYGVKVNEDIQGDFTLIGLTKERALTTCEVEGKFNDFPIELIKPYLFPLSSMTEELKNFIRWKLTTPKYDSFDEESLEDLFNNNIQVVNFCYEHHLDISGLIEKSLALDATNLGIYE